MLVGAVISSLILGFLAGLLTFKRKQMWCSTCGITLACLPCTARQEAERQQRVAAEPGS